MVYDNVRYIHSKDAIQCKKCLAIIHSKSRDEFKWCSCRTVGIDCVGYFAMDGKNKVWLSQEVMESYIMIRHLI